MKITLDNDITLVGDSMDNQKDGWALLYNKGELVANFRILKIVRIEANGSGCLESTKQLQGDR